jgi:RNA recognition motif-containing protein
MEELILQEFEKCNSKANHILMIKNLNFGLLQKLNPKQQDEFQPAVNNLIDKGFIIYEDATSGPECLRLTELGFEQLYKNSMPVEQIKSSILKQFENQNSRAGHILMIKNLNFGLLQKMNPKEQGLFNPAIEQLIEEELITYEDGSSGVECLRLTDLGFEQLY